jgi:hypothetical protein
VTWAVTGVLNEMLQLLVAARSRTTKVQDRSHWVMLPRCWPSYSCNPYFIGHGKHLGHKHTTAIHVLMSPLTPCPHAPLILQMLYQHQHLVVCCLQEYKCGDIEISNIVHPTCTQVTVTADLFSPGGCQAATAGCIAVVLQASRTCCVLLQQQAVWCMSMQRRHGSVACLMHSHGRPTIPRP